ncbi:hypothetical protein EUBVEN_02785 [Eubacterium ventriosum ATCC 27560]|uniref:Uncharacterized protein n=1 Tax=Eubacterium ventriosum ATCC 27560 TaxID=411463 RepID=A5ZAN4_9FIRM|nr:hypothetical protein EUBVEN_02785 [Eubacterium ventriosum ATCC 27560]
MAKNQILKRLQLKKRLQIQAKVVQLVLKKQQKQEDKMQPKEREKLNWQRKMKKSLRKCIFGFLWQFHFYSF